MARCDLTILDLHDKIIIICNALGYISIKIGRNVFVSMSESPYVQGVPIITYSIEYLGVIRLKDIPIYNYTDPYDVVKELQENFYISLDGVDLLPKRNQHKVGDTVIDSSWGMMIFDGINWHII